MAEITHSLPVANKDKKKTEDLFEKQVFENYNKN